MKELFGASVGHALAAFMGFFAIMNPIANTAVFVGLTADDDAETRRKIAARALTVSFVIVVVFAAAGKIIFDLFGITLAAFRIMGGVLVAIVGYQMMHGGEGSAIQHPTRKDGAGDADAAVNVAITPLAMPILAGPGTIATAMSFASGRGVRELIVTVVAFFLLCVISYVFFRSGERLVRYLGRQGVNIVNRLMGLILAVIGAQMLIEGVGGAVREFLEKSAG